MLNLTPYDLSVDTLDVHAVSTRKFCQVKLRLFKSPRRVV